MSKCLTWASSRCVGFQAGSAPAKQPFARAVLACACVIFSTSGLALAGNQFTETFTTTTYKDPANTTADWNTAAGQLKLFPFVPSLVGFYDTPGEAYGVVVAGDLAFVADGDLGLQIMDVLTPSSPTLLGTYDTPGFAQGVAVAGDLAFVADWAVGLQIVSITDPVNPALVGTYATPTAQGVTVAGDLAFIAGNYMGLRIVDVSDPASPTLVGVYDGPGFAYAVAVAGNLAFVANYLDLQIIDITDPASPTLVASYDTPGLAYGVAVDGDLAIVGDYYAGLSIIDITDPANPIFVGGYDTPGSAYGVAVDGDVAFVADQSAGLHMIDIVNPASPTLVGTYDTAGGAFNVAVEGDLAFVADTDAGLQIINARHPVTLPTLTGVCSMPAQIGGVEVAGDLAFVADWGSGLHVVDIADPSNPAIVGSYDTPGSAYGVAVDGDLAFVADGNGGLQIINIANHASPTYVGSAPTPLALNVAVDGNLAVVAVAGSGLRIISIANPSLPTTLSSYYTAGTANDVDVAGDLVFVANGTSGLEIASIADPTNPVHVATFSTGGEIAYTVDVAGDLVFVANGTAGLKIISIATPASPMLVGSYDTASAAYDVAVAGNLAVLACIAGVQLVDVTNPASPALVGACGASAFAWSAVVAGDHVFVADSADLGVIQVFQHEVDALRNIGRSLAVDGGADVIRRVRLSTTQTAGVGWEVSADNVNWQAINPNDAWNLFWGPGNDLRWRSTHTWSLGVDPIVFDLHLEWLYDYGVIEAVTDVPGDQGGRVYVEWMRSAYDFADEATYPVTGYNLYRRVDDAALTAATHDNRSAAVVDELVTPSGATAWPLPGVRAVCVQGRTYVTGSAAATEFPPGTWVLVWTAFATQNDRYRAEATTAADSSASGPHHSVYLVTTHTTTPSLWFVSPLDSGYSIDNIAPAVPANFAVAYNTGSGNALVWDESPDEDFQYFRVYRASAPDFEPSPATLVHSTTVNGWADPDYDGWQVYYKVTATDFSGNESEPASAGTTTAIGEPRLPRTFALYPNVPNPFNPTTVIRYDVPGDGGGFTLRIYDVSGRLVRTLADGVQSAGEKSVMWDGRDERGRQVASGVYFYRLTAVGFASTHKMVLMK